MKQKPKIEVIADSLSASQNRITTVKLTFWLNDEVQDELITVASTDAFLCLSNEIKDAICDSIPIQLNELEWHVPFVSNRIKESYPLGSCLQISAARCARVSKKLYDGASPSKEDDINLFNQLRMHAPMEESYMTHQAVYSKDKRKWVFYSELFK